MNSLNLIAKCCNISKQLSCMTFIRNNSKLTAVKSKKKIGPGKLGPIVEKKIIPVETDPQKLVNYVCGSNILKTGEDIKLKPDSDYPDWLWNIHTGPAPKLDELDPNTKQYWRRLRKLGLKRNNKLSKLKPF